MHDRDRAEQDSRDVDEQEKRGEGDPPVRVALGGARDLLGDHLGQADGVRDQLRLEPDRACQQPEAGDDEERERKGEQEQPVGECASEHAAADVGISFDRLEGGVERRRASAGLLDPAFECVCVLHPERQALEGQRRPGSRQLDLLGFVLSIWRGHQLRVGAGDGSSRRRLKPCPGCCVSACRQFAQVGEKTAQATEIVIRTKPQPSRATVTPKELKYFPSALSQPPRNSGAQAHAPPMTIEASSAPGRSARSPIWRCSRKRGSRARTPSRRRARPVRARTSPYHEVGRRRRRRRRRLRR